MIKDAVYDNIFIACGYTDLRYGIDGLAANIKENFEINPYVERTIFLFCGRKNDRIKALVWEGDGFVLLYKRLESGRFRWPRNYEDLRKMTPDEFSRLMKGFSVYSSISKIDIPEKVL